MWFHLLLSAYPLEYFSAHLSMLASKQVSPLPGALCSLVFSLSPIWGIPFLCHDASTLEASKKSRRGKTGAVCSLTFNGGSFRLDAPKANVITSITTITGKK